MTPTWYDLLDVAPDASADEIRAAWRRSIADLEPGDRGFETRNEAAAVLLDPERRAAYDASLAGAGTALTHQEAERERARVERQRSKELSREEARQRRSEEKQRRGAGQAARSATGPVVPTWLLAALAALAAVLVAVTLVVWQGGFGLDADGGLDEDEVRDAQAAAERAVVPVVSYDHATLEEDRAEAEGYLTDSYREEYDQLFSVIEENAPGTETVVGAEVVASGLVRTGEDRVDVLVFVDRPTSNKLNPEPVVYRDQVTLRMLRVGEEWLVDDLVTSPVQE